jgi:hypothetical protein
MINKKLLFGLLSALVLVLIVLIQAQEQETYFEARFDGAWEGSIRIKTEAGLREFPAILNLNSYKESGTGSALLPDNFELAPQDLIVYALTKFSVKGSKITLKIDVTTAPDKEGGTETYTHTLTLSHKKTSGILKGNFKSTDPLIKGKRPMTLFPQGPSKITQKVWEGTITIDKVKTPVLLQLMQKDPLEETETAQITGVTGFGFLGDDYGKITNGSFDGKTFTGNLNLKSELVLLDLDLQKGPRLKGKFNGMTFTKNVTLKPAGTNGNLIQLTKAAPNVLTVNEFNTVTIIGKNFHPGVMAHMNDAGAMVDMIEYVSKSKILACLKPSTELQGGQEISLRMINVNGEYIDLDAAFTIDLIEEPTPISFSQDIQPVFNQNCALSGCHASPSPAQGLNLSQGLSYNSLVNTPSSQRPSVLRVAPFEPNNSYLIHKIKGENINGFRMPLNSSPLSVELIALFENWVRQGALNN